MAQQAMTYAKSPEAKQKSPTCGARSSQQRKPKPR